MESVALMFPGRRLKAINESINQSTPGRAFHGEGATNLEAALPGWSNKFLTAAQKDALSFFADFMSMTEGFRTLY